MTDELPHPMQPDSTNPPPWQVQERFLELRSRWFSLIGERLQDNRGQILDYWRVEKADSAIILPLYNNSLLLPPPSYRPGVGQYTLDFPGGRVGDGESCERAAVAILQRELGIAADAIARLLPLNAEGWAVNSSFSNQKLYGFIAELNENSSFDSGVISYETHSAGIERLLQALTCLQCRALLREWQLVSG